MLVVYFPIIILEVFVRMMMAMLPQSPEIAKSKRDAAGQTIEVAVRDLFSFTATRSR